MEAYQVVPKQDKDALRKWNSMGKLLFYLVCYHFDVGYIADDAKQFTENIFACIFVKIAYVAKQMGKIGDDFSYQQYLQSTLEYFFVVIF